jgi:hypothetical protein
VTKTRTKAVKHGLRGLMAGVSHRGLGALDKRSAGYRALQEWRQGLERDLGGHENLSEQQRTLVELATRTRLFLDHLDQFLMGLDSIINKRNRRAVPLLTTRMQLSDSLSRTLTQLGLQRQVHVPTLQEYLASPEHEAALAAAREEEAAYQRDRESAAEPSSDANDAPASAATPAIEESQR